MLMKLLPSRIQNPELVFSFNSSVSASERRVCANCSAVGAINSPMHTAISNQHHRADHYCRTKFAAPRRPELRITVSSELLANVPEPHQRTDQRRQRKQFKRQARHGEHHVFERHQGRVLATSDFAYVVNEGNKTEQGNQGDEPNQVCLARRVARCSDPEVSCRSRRPKKYTTLALMWSRR